MTDVQISEVNAGVYFPAFFVYAVTHNLIVVEPVMGEVPIFEFSPGKVNYIGSYTKKEENKAVQVKSPDWRPQEIKPALARSSVPSLSERLKIEAPTTGFVSCNHPRFLKNLKGIKCTLTRSRV